MCCNYEFVQITQHTHYYYFNMCTISYFYIAAIRNMLLFCRLKSSINRSLSLLPVSMHSLISGY